MYLLTAAADLVRVDGVGRQKAVYDAVHRLWDNMVSRKMYLTGGIGTMKKWEGFRAGLFPSARGRRGRLRKSI